MSFRVRLTRSAAADFEQRLANIAERSPRYAQRLNDRFEKALFRLREFLSPAAWLTKTHFSLKS
jgi:hypothetical protein